MGKNKAKLISLIGISASSLALIAYPLLLRAQEETISVVTLEILPGDITIVAPDNFSFDRIFLPPPSDPDFYIYKTLLPETEAQVVKVVDGDVGLNDFAVTMALSNFTSEGNSVIPFTSFAALTLANNEADDVDSGPTSPSAGSSGITAPWRCDWDGQSGTLAEHCGASFDDGAFTGLGSLSPLDPTAPITSSDTIIPVTDSLVYNPGDVLLLSGDEYATVRSVPSLSEIEVIRGVSGTVASLHNAESGITNLGTYSAQIVMLDSVEPPEGRIGTYSVGLGMRGRLEPADLTPETYSGEIIFTLSTCPVTDPLC